ncbi:hypothetical protein DXT87_16975 [Arthrobacter sp. AET 35A]|nr:hypothetical protein [Arthrobacter sp. AET 35A]
MATAITGAALLGGCSVPDGPRGDATWHLARPADVSADSTSLEVGVERAACASGRTGTVLEPEVTYETDRIIVTTYVEPLTGGVQSCQGNDVVPLTVELGEPIGERKLVDGVCLVPDAVPASLCEDDGVRWAIRTPSASAVWGLPKGEVVRPGSTSFRVDVTRTGCSGGVTGRVLEPMITYGADQIIIRTDVEPLPEGAYDCPGNEIVEKTVELSEPVGDRELVDAACVTGDAVTTTFCEDDGVRWAPR